VRPWTRRRTPKLPPQGGDLGEGKLLELKQGTGQSEEAA
jgi:hypothetical protein